MARVANSAPVTVGAITAQWPLIQWTTSPFGTPPNTIIQTAVSTGARGSAIFTSSNSTKYRHLGVVRSDFLVTHLTLVIITSITAASSARSSAQPLPTGLLFHEFRWQTWYDKFLTAV